MKRDQVEADVVVGIVAGNVYQSGIAGLSSSQAECQLIMPRINPFQFIHSVRQYSRPTSPVFQSSDVIAELVGYTVCKAKAVIRIDLDK